MNGFRRLRRSSEQRKTYHSTLIRRATPIHLKLRLITSHHPRDPTHFRHTPQLHKSRTASEMKIQHHPACCPQLRHEPSSVDAQHTSASTGNSTLIVEVDSPMGRDGLKLPTSSSRPRVAAFMRSRCPEQAHRIARVSEQPVVVTARASRVMQQNGGEVLHENESSRASRQFLFLISDL